MLTAKSYTFTHLNFHLQIGELTEDGFFLLKLVFFSVVIGIFAFTAILFILSQTLLVQ